MSGAERDAGASWRTRFPILVIDAEMHEDTAGGRAVREVVEALENIGHRVLRSSSHEDGRYRVLARPEIGAVLINLDPDHGEREEEGSRSVVESLRRRNPDVPIFACSERERIERIPAAMLGQIDGYLWKLEDTPRFMAGHVEDAARRYLDALLPPFFAELLAFSARAKYSWHTPGHSGGVAFLKSPVGHAFADFYGENTLRSDLSVSVPELGSLHEHSGVVGTAEREAARVFGADRTYFVTNGTSTANHMVWHGSVCAGDVVLVDRNCHKSIMYSIIMTGAVPVYLQPTRNRYGIIGPVPPSELDEVALERKLAQIPLIDETSVRPRLAVLTNSTYDGLCYDVERVTASLAEQVDVLHFDEAWFGYARFHELYAGRYAMSDAISDAAHRPLLFATQSTHKVLAAFSQGSMIHARDGSRLALDHERFNEAFMMHTSTSPAYGIIASLDVATRMMKAPAGHTLLAEAIAEAIAFRRRLTNIRDELSGTDWWFSIWQPDAIAGETTSIVSPGDQEAPSAEAWTLEPEASWHGFDGLNPGYALLDPIKVTLLMPGVTIDGSPEAFGVPAAIVGRFLSTRGVVVEKTGLYSFLVLFTIGVTKGKWGTLIAELFRFKVHHDSNTSLEEVFPDLVAAHPGAYAGRGLRDLCDEMHEHHRRANTLTRADDSYTTLPTMTMTPAAAYSRLVRGEVERVSLDELDGRTAAVMVVPYPPGIPVIMPGERFDSEAASIPAFLRDCRAFDARFPGFETEIHGLSIEDDGDGVPRYTIECLR